MESEMIHPMGRPATVQSSVIGKGEASVFLSHFDVMVMRCVFDPKA